jgi:outer membrane assembly lipoprotein YfiO
MTLRTPGTRSCAAILGVVTLLAGCGPAPAALPSGVQPDQYLAEQGSLALADQDWYEARLHFQQLLDSYPQSPLRPEAKLGMGDAFFAEDSPASYIQAINEYREFLTFYPSNPRAAYAQYRIGMANYNQMRRAERDQSKTEDAIEEFEIFVERYPNSELMPEVRTKLRDARDRLSESQYLVGYFYFRQQWYPGAIIRFRDVLERDPEFTGRDAIYFYLAEALYQIQRGAEALPYYERLIAEFEQSEYLGTAWERVRELKADETQPNH